ncbi:MAG: NADH-quinone oxidoreductase subunit N [Acidimicrobiia bacterium]|nr:NADH-quinone oxidoreductase subunit N [Acidimicrobiia bacterium]
MNPHIDFHALAPEIVLAATLVVVLVADLLLPDRERWQTSRLATIGVLAAFVPVITLAVDGADRSMFGGAYVVDNYALAFKGFFILVAYVVLLMSVDYISEGDYYQGEFYFVLLTSVLGMSVMGSARDLVSIFIALETITMPTFVLAGWRKHDTKSNEAAIKYLIIGVLSSALMLYGMSLVYGMSGSTLLTDIGAFVAKGGTPPLMIVAMFLTIAGFAFKVSAVPFHFWVPDTYEGAPTPVTAFLSVASKAGGFAALVSIVFVGFYPDKGAWQPTLWVLAAASMTLGNLTALRQTNIVRMLAYSSIAQGGFILVPLAVAGESASAANSAREAVIIYLLIYGAMNLGAFAVVMALARRTRSGEISSYAGLMQYSPGLALVMSAFMFSLAGVPPLAGWFAKFVMFRAVIDAATPAAVTLGVIAAVNSVIAFFYYVGVVRQMWLQPAPEGTEDRPVRIPMALSSALAITTVVVVVVGVYPQVFAKIGELARLAG